MATSPGGWVNTDSLDLIRTEAPFGEVVLRCSSFDTREGFYNENMTYGSVDVFEQVNGGAPSFFTMAPSSGESSRLKARGHRATPGRADRASGPSAVPAASKSLCAPVSPQ